MPKNRLNYLLYCKNVVNIVNEHYEEGWTTYAAVWRRYVNPVYPMSYQKFINIINMPNLYKQIAEAEAEAATPVNRRLVYPKRKMPTYDADILSNQMSCLKPKNQKKNHKKNKKC